MQSISPKQSLASTLSENARKLDIEKSMSDYQQRNMFTRSTYAKIIHNIKNNLCVWTNDHKKVTVFLQQNNCMYCDNNILKNLCKTDGFILTSCQTPANPRCIPYKLLYGSNYYENWYMFVLSL